MRARGDGRSLFAAVAIAAEDETDFAASKGSALEAQLHERLKAGIRTIPGTAREFLVGGDLAPRHRVAQETGGDGQTPHRLGYALRPGGRRLPAERAAVVVPVALAHADLDQLRVDAPRGKPLPVRRQDRTELNAALRALWRALTVGETYSTFMDDGALPTTLDYNGPSGVTFVRQWLARASIPVGAGWAPQTS